MDVFLLHFILPLSEVCFLNFLHVFSTIREIIDLRKLVLLLLVWNKRVLQVPLHRSAVSVVKATL